VEMRFAHRFDHQGVNDQPTACGRMGRRSLAANSFSGEFAARAPGTIRPQSRLQGFKG